MSNEVKLNFVYCDFTNAVHKQNLVALINHYMADPMGGCKALLPEQEDKLIEGLAANPSCFVLFVQLDNTFIGLATCFVNFSTFNAKPYINIHDVIIDKACRDQGIGRRLMQKIIDIAREQRYCKVTLEVRDDNTNAKALYRSLGFNDSDPVMHFWTKVL